MARFSGKRRFSRFSRKRRIRPTWFPTLGTNWVSGPDNWWDAGFNVVSNFVPQGLADGPDTQVIPVTKDITLTQEQSANDTGYTLRDAVEGQTFLLERLVGNLFLQVASDNTDINPNSWPYVRVAAAFFIARAEEGIPDLPDLFSDEYDILNVNNIQNPWIWRNQWILRNPDGEGFGVSNVDFPQANALCTGFQSPHFDTKVKRKIVREHRLWFAVSAIGWDGNSSLQSGSAELQPYVRAHLDLRILGRMQRGRNISTF